jgi:hypothetical protein
MNIQDNPMINALNDLDATTNILLAALLNSKEDSAHQAISVMLMQGMHYFGNNDAVIQQFFPVWDAIGNDIESIRMEKALSQARTWKAQLQEVIEIVKNRQGSN